MTRHRKPTPGALAAARAELAAAGGRARAASITPERRREIALNASRARWGKRKPTEAEDYALTRAGLKSMTKPDDAS